MGASFVESFVVERMRRAFPRICYSLHEGALGWRFDAQHPEDGRNVSFEIRATKMFSATDRARFLREIDTILLAPSQDWRMHQDYV